MLQQVALHGVSCWIDCELPTAAVPQVMFTRLLHDFTDS